MLPVGVVMCDRPGRYFLGGGGGGGGQFSRELARLYEYSYLGPVLIMNIHTL